MTDRLSIGRFARLTGLTVKALRHYDEVGVLPAAHVGPANGYRYYAPEQLEAALAIRRLRALELPLEEIRAVLGGADLREMLSAHRARVRARAADTLRILAELDSLIDDEEELVPEDVLYRIEIKDVPEQHLAVIRGRTRFPQLSTWLDEAFDELYRFIDERGAERAGSPFAVCPEPSEEEMEVQAAWPVSEPLESAGRVEGETRPAFRALASLHRGRYEDLPRVYRALWSAIRDEGIETAGEPREVYLTNPHETEPSENLTEVLWPVRLEPGWTLSEEKFTRPLPPPQPERAR